MTDRYIVFAENDRAVSRGIDQRSPTHFVATQYDADIEDYIADFSSWLGTDTIASVLRTPSGPTVTSTSNTTTTVTQSLQGFGCVLIGITTTAGRVKNFTIEVGRVGGSTSPNFTYDTSGQVGGNVVAFYDRVSSAQGAYLTSSTLVIETEGYASAGDGGAGRYVRAASLPSHSGYFRSADGTYWELVVDDQINVKQFGATGDGSTDDIIAVNAAIDYIRVKLTETDEDEPGYIVAFPHGTYRVTSGINATGIRTRAWGIRGPGKILLDFNGGNGLDLTDSRWCKIIEPLKIKTNSGKVPDVGVLLARQTGGRVADVNTLSGLDVKGTFAISACHNYASEDCDFGSASFVNNSTSLTTYCLSLDGSNVLGAASSFKTIATGAQSMNDAKATHIDLRKGAGPCLYLTHTEGVGLDGYCATTSDAAIVIRTTSTDINSDVRLNIHCETTGLASCVRFEGDATHTINGFEFRDYAPQASDQIFQAGSGVTGVTLRDAKISIDRFGVTPTNGLFDDYSKFLVADGRVYTPTLADRTQASRHPGWTSGRYYYLASATAANALLITENRLYFCPLSVPASAIADRVGFNITVAAGDAQCQVKLGIYRNSRGSPGQLIRDAGFLTIGTSTAKLEQTISQLLPESWVWLAVIANRNGGATGTMPTVRTALTGSSSLLTEILGDTNFEPGNQITALYADVTPGTWASYVLPTTPPTLTRDNTEMPILGIRAA